MLSGSKSAGHPVDIATGVVYSVHEDIYVPGRFPLKWERKYSTAMLDTKPGPLGPGWMASCFSTLKPVQDGYEFVGPEGDFDFFEDPQGTIDQGGTITNFPSFQELSRNGSRLIVTRWDVETYEINRFIFTPGKTGIVWPLQRIENIAGQGLDLFYDESGQLTRIRQGIERRQLLLGYNDSRLITSVTLVLADGSHHVLVRYDYDAEQRLAAVYNALGHADQYAYDRHHRLVREYIKNNAVYDFSYDDKGRCIQTSGTDGYDRKIFRYHELIGRTEVKDSHGQTTFYQWKPDSGQVVEEIKPTGAIYKTAYDDFNRIILETLPNGRIAGYEYDGNGNRCRIIDGQGQATDIAFNAYHQPVTLTNPAGHVWRRDYNENHQVASIENPQKDRYIFKYDETGGIAEITNPLGHKLRQTFSQDGLLESVSDLQDNITRYGLDGFGRIIETIDPFGKRTAFRYDPAGNLIRIDYPDGTAASALYDESGNLTQLTDRQSHTTHYEYGPCNWLVKRIDSLGNSVKLSWDSEPGWLNSITNDKGEVYHYEYNAVGDVIGEIDFDGREMRYSYDLNGNRIAEINGLGQRTEYTYDGFGRLTGITLPDGSKTAFSYDANGFLAKAGNADSEVTFERDNLGRIVRENQNGHLIEREYDQVGNMRRLKSELGFTVDYHFDANHQLKQFTLNGNESIRFQRDALGSEVQRLLPNHVRLDQQFDSLGRLSSQMVYSNTNNPFRSLDDSSHPVIKRNFQYAGEHLSKIEDSFWGDVSFAYDPVGRLTQTLRDLGETEQFQFDVNDNITRMTRGTVSSDLDYDGGNRLTARDHRRYLYDEQGRLVQKIEKMPDGDEQAWLFEWDALDQLRAVTNPGGQTWQYAYDPFGRRIRKVSSDGRIRHFVWDEDVILHEMDENNAAISWVFDPNGYTPLCKLEGDAFYAIITDHLGTPQEMIDGQGDIVWRTQFTAWGGIRHKHIGTTDCPVGFAGQWYDNETGLCYNRFRYYDPDAAQFISSDPIGLMGGLNLYRYAADPNLWIDPLGLACGPAVRQNSNGQWIDAQGKFARAPSVSQLARLRGRSVGRVESILRSRGFTRTNPANPRNQRWVHPDGSEVQIHAYGNQATGPYPSGNNAHAHKSLGRHGNPGTTELADDGRTAVSTHSDAAHIGLRNPADFPAVAGRPHGT